MLIGALLSLGGGFRSQTHQVFLAEDGHAHEGQIGLIFALGSLTLSVAAFAAPFAAEKLGRMRAIWLTRFAAIPFILLLGFAPELATPQTVVSLAGAAFVLRTALFNMSGPLYEAFHYGVAAPERTGHLHRPLGLGRKRPGRRCRVPRRIPHGSRQVPAPFTIMAGPGADQGPVRGRPLGRRTPVSTAVVTVGDGILTFESGTSPIGG